MSAYQHFSSAAGASERTEAIKDLRAMTGAARNDAESQLYKRAFRVIECNPRACFEDCIYAGLMALYQSRMQ